MKARDRLVPDWRGALYGAVAAVVGAACMTVIRSASRRLGLIQKTVPQVIEEKAASRLGLDFEGKPSLHHAADQGLHLMYGATQGAAYGALVGQRKRPTLQSGTTLGLASWLLGSGLVVPVTSAGRGLFRRGLAENATDLLAHLVFGLATELVRDDLLSHADETEPADDERRTAPTG